LNDPSLGAAGLGDRSVQAFEGGLRGVVVADDAEEVKRVVAAAVGVAESEQLPVAEVERLP
jgi:hypothetical protein